MKKILLILATLTVITFSLTSCLTVQVPAPSSHPSPPQSGHPNASSSEGSKPSIDNWETNDITKGIPKPDSGHIVSFTAVEDLKGYIIYFSGVTEKAATDYIEKLKNDGFTAKHNEQSSINYYYYDATKGDKFISVTYSSGGMNIFIK